MALDMQRIRTLAREVSVVAVSASVRMTLDLRRTGSTSGLLQALRARGWRSTSPVVSASVRMTLDPACVVYAPGW
jgi:hypothetical protein